MADYTVPDVTVDESTATTTDTKHRRPSIILLIAGMGALMLAIPTLVGSNPTAIVAFLMSGWTFVVVAVGIGIVLVLAPIRRRRSQQ